MVDMRALSQSDLVALAAGSPYSADPRRGRDADVLPPPKIDRAVFNESAGSRKQTFSRHRVATNLSHSLTPATASAAAAPPPPPPTRTPRTASSRSTSSASSRARTPHSHPRPRLHRNPSRKP